MDIADIADKDNELLNEINMRNHHAKFHVHDHDQPTGYCVDCGEPIPESRLKAIPGCVRCVECQADYERNHH